MATILMRARELARRLQLLPGLIESETIRAEKATIEEALKLAQEMSSGVHSLADIARAGHPYSRRAPQPDAYPANVINKQKGLFFRGWRTELPHRVGNEIVSGLRNIDPKAAFMEGTDKMIPRPIAPAVLAIILPKREKRLQEARLSAYRKAFQ